MPEKLDRIMEYWTLSRRATPSGKGLPARDAERLERLRTQLGTQVPSLDERDPYTLLAEPLEAEVLHGESSLAATLRNASAGGAALATRGTPPPLGQRVMIRARDPQGGHQYELHGTVVARVMKGEQAVSIAFDGTPRKISIGGQSGVYARPTSATPATESSGTPTPRKGAGGK